MLHRFLRFATPLDTWIFVNVVDVLCPIYICMTDINLTTITRCSTKQNKKCNLCFIDFYLALRIKKYTKKYMLTFGNNNALWLMTDTCERDKCLRTSCSLFFPSFFSPHYLYIFILEIDRNFFQLGHIRSCTKNSNTPLHEHQLSKHPSTTPPESWVCV